MGSVPQNRPARNTPHGGPNLLPPAGLPWTSTRILVLNPLLGGYSSLLLTHMLLDDRGVTTVVALSIRLSSMSDFHYPDFFCPITNLVNHAILTYPDAPIIL